MDRQLGSDIRRKRILRRSATGAALVLGAAALFLLLPGWLRPALARARILTAKVDRGTVEADVQASGTVLPAHETVVSSPIDTRVIRILKRPGDAVRRGEALLELDTQAPRLDLERLEDRLAQKANEQAQIKLALERELDALDGQIQKAEMDERILTARHQRNQRLYADGLLSEDELRESDVLAQKAAIELAGLQRSVERARRASEAQAEGLRLDLAILQKEAREARHRVQLATASADADGVLTWIVREEGASVQRGDALARVAQLDRFRVEATLSDVHAERILAGQRANVVLPDATLAGTIESVYPQIENGALRFTVALEQASHPALRQNLRVDVHAVTGARSAVLRLRRGPFARTGALAQQVFVLDGDGALQRRVTLGIAGREYVEIVAGLTEGEEVIVSDMTDYAHLERIGLR